VSGKEQFIKLPREVLESEAWRSVGINGLRLLHFLMIEHMRQGGKRNGFLLAPRRHLYAFGIGAHFVSGAIEEVERAGLVDCKRGVGRRPNYYALSWLPAADGAAPSHRWRSVVNAVSTQNECQTAFTKPVVNAKEQPQGAKSLTAKQHAPSRRSCQGSGSIKEAEWYGTAEGIGPAPCEGEARSQASAPPGSPDGGQEPELDPARRCSRYVTNGFGHRICGNSVVVGTDYCPDHALRVVGA